MTEANLRMLLVDGCQLNAWLVKNLAPADVSVELTQSFDRAREILRSHPPHAAIFNITPSDLPWQELAQLCRDHVPPIPFVWCSTVHDDLVQVGARPGPDEYLCYKPVAVPEMRRHIEELVARARRGGEAPEAERRSSPPPEAQV